MNEFSILFSIDKQHPCYSDHFPGYAVVPGALLLEWINKILLEKYADHYMSGISSFKFLQPVFPCDVLKINFQVTNDISSVRVEYFRILEQSIVPELVAKGKLNLMVMNIKAHS